MNLNTKFNVAIVLGIIILVADLLWLYGSVFRYGGIANRNLPYRNLTSNTNTTFPSFNNSHNAFRGGGYLSSIDILYGLVILVADVIWLYLEFGTRRVRAKR